MAHSCNELGTTLIGNLERKRLFYFIACFGFHAKILKNFKGIIKDAEMIAKRLRRIVILFLNVDESERERESLSESPKGIISKNRFRKRIIIELLKEKTKILREKSYVASSMEVSKGSLNYCSTKTRVRNSS